MHSLKVMDVFGQYEGKSNFENEIFLHTDRKGLKFSLAWQIYS